jgi:hypothetical protein
VFRVHSDESTCLRLYIYMESVKESRGTCYQVGVIMSVEPKHLTIGRMLLNVFIGYCLKVDDMKHYCCDHMHTGKSH